MGRGARRAPVFPDDAACIRFLALLAALPNRYGLLVHGYALMPNHFHLMLESERGHLSRGMAFLIARYTYDLNRRCGWDGPVFRGRFHSRAVVLAEHWTYLLAYLHLNPVRAGIVNRVDRAHWTSHGAYAGSEKRPDWLTSEPLLEELGGEPGYRDFVRDVRLGRKPAPELFDAVRFTGRRGAGRPPAGRTVTKRARPVSPKRALAEVAHATGVAVAELTISRMGRVGNLPRLIAAYWLVRRSGLRNVEVSRLLGMHPVRVSQAIGRVLATRSDDPRIGDPLAELEALAGNA